MNTDFEKVKIQLCSMAAGHGWKHIKTQQWCLNFEKTNTNSRMVMNIYWNYRVANGLTAPMFTVQTAMNHPIKGKTQLNRRGIGLSLLAKIFENPRFHTEKGYY